MLPTEVAVWVPCLLGNQCNASNFSVGVIASPNVSVRVKMVLKQILKILLVTSCIWVWYAISATANSVAKTESEAIATFRQFLYRCDYGRYLAPKRGAAQTLSFANAYGRSKHSNTIKNLLLQDLCSDMKNQGFGEVIPI